ncbi:cupin domain-containing protein [Paenibacillus glycanilyticus]|uniref:Cupin type-2 domain-containing protein n=1 Tax=Paenibacillus glycanilyticus TaxID=126569 RepID=A0ABQ6GJJ2_9BACL|nr:cupin domain-containing protein [Paenibacillus glycanilyticus]GLX69797.1 hypothetical protein MU1_41430 [Paenibacillus glycanilyticus]
MYNYPYRYYQWPSSQWSYYWDPRYYNWSYYAPRPYHRDIVLQDYGSNPFVVDLKDAAEQNHNYRVALWSGHYFQLTLMSIKVGEDIGLEVHPATDQFIRIEEGKALVQMGDSQDHLDLQVMAYEGYAIIVPAGTWHNVTNTGNKPLKVSSIYAPPQHPFGTVEETKPLND